jgi:tetratricopeptide (TPR) repeat protein
MAITIQATPSPLRDQYRLVRVIGSSQSADEYLGVNRRTGEEVLVQVIRPGAAPTVDARESILGRLASATGFERPDVLPIRQVSLDDERVIVIRDRPAGVSLASILTAGPSPLDWSAGVVVDALRAVEAALGAAVAHPGLTPTNVFVTPDGRVQVSDFGLPLLPPATVLPERGEGRSVPPLEALVRAPELVVGRVADLPAQQYAAAALFLWLISGTPPVRAAVDVASSAHQASLTSVLVAAGAPESLAPHVARSLADSPSDRTSTLSEFVAALEGLRRKPALGASPRPGRRWLWFGGAAAAASAAALLLFGAWQAARFVDEAAAATRPASTQLSEVGAPTPLRGEIVLYAPQASIAAPEPAASALDRAQACWGHDWPCAIAALEALTAIRPTDRDVSDQLVAAHVNHGLALTAAGAIEAARAAFQAALAVRPDDPTAQLRSALADRYLAGVTAYDVADWPNAIRSFEAVANVDATFGDVDRLLAASLTNGGLQALRAGDVQRATALCAEAQRRGGDAGACLAEIRARSAASPQRGATRPQPDAPAVTLAAPAPVATTIVVRTQNVPRHRTTWLP